MGGQDLWNVYLSGEIHSNWRDEIRAEIVRNQLPVHLDSPVTDHSASDNCGVEILGAETDSFWKDQKGAGLNAIRTRTLIRRADLVIIRFGPKYRQWNAAFDAGVASALGKPIVTFHEGELDHALKEIDQAAYATARDVNQVIGILQYVTQYRSN